MPYKLLQGSSPFKKLINKDYSNKLYKLQLLFNLNFKI